MAAAASVPFTSIEEYLHSVYEPDMDYVDGVLEERNLGELDHSGLQRRLLLFLCRINDSLEERTFPEARVQVSPTRFRVPDLCVLAPDFQDTTIIRRAPQLCIEVLSPEDRMTRVLARCRDFLAMGVPEVWVFDPVSRTASRMLADGTLQEAQGTLRVAGTEIAIDLDAVFRTPGKGDA